MVRLTSSSEQEDFRRRRRRRRASLIGFVEGERSALGKDQIQQIREEEEREGSAKGERRAELVPALLLLGTA